MSDRQTTMRAYSKDRQKPQRQSISINLETSTNSKMTSENYYSNRNCPEILSLFALSQKHFDHREKQLYHPITNDIYAFHTINYPLQSPPPTPDSKSENEKQPVLPKLTPRSTAAAAKGKKFPASPKRNNPIIAEKHNSMPIIRTSVKPTQIKTPSVLKDKSKKI